MTLVWETVANKKVAQYKGFTLTMTGHRVTFQDPLNIIPSLEFNNLRPVLSYIDSITAQRKQSQEESDYYSLGCCDDL